MTDRHVALVTGGGKGIGAAIARHVARSAAHVHVTGRDLEACETVAGEIRDAGGSAGCVRIDVTDRTSVAAGIELATDVAGPVDWLVSNAGIAVDARLLEGGDAYQRHLDVNFHGARHVIEALLPGMRERKAGRIVCVASSAGLQGYAQMSAYCASKHALVGYARAAALELERTGVTINLVCPHFVDSPLMDRAVEGLVASTGMRAERLRGIFASKNPGGHMVTMDEVAESVTQLLLSEQNGTIVELDGSGGR